MNIETVKALALALQLFNHASFIAHINGEEDYQAAFSLMNNLIEDYDQHRALIEVLAVSIERWEDSAAEFSQFNQSVN